MSWTQFSGSDGYSFGPFRHARRINQQYPVSSVLLALCRCLLLVRMRGGDFRVCEKASKTFCELVACTEAQRVLGASKGT
jgi:hypothetical protein